MHGQESLGIGDNTGDGKNIMLPRKNMDRNYSGSPNLEFFIMPKKYESGNNQFAPAWASRPPGTWRFVASRA